MANKIKIFSAFIIMWLFYSCGSSSSNEILSFFFDGVTVSDSASIENTRTSVSRDSTVINKKDLITAEKIKPVILFHPPYQEKMCDNCHDAGSSNKLVMELPGLCYQCHEDFSSKFSNLHYPVEDGECTACHNPHFSKYGKLLIKPVDQLCSDCHDVDELLSGELHDGIKKNECMDCHNPHGSNESSLMR